MLVFQVPRSTPFLLLSEGFALERAELILPAQNAQIPMSVIIRNRSALFATTVVVPVFYRYRRSHESLGHLLPDITLEARIGIDRPGIIVGIPEIV